MAKCKNCVNIIDCVNPKGEEFKWCHIKNDCPDLESNRECEHYEPKSKGDNIRSMNNREMAVFLQPFLPGFLTVDDVEKWLEEEVEG